MDLNIKDIYISILKYGLKLRVRSHTGDISYTEDTIVIYNFGDPYDHTTITLPKK